MVGTSNVQVDGGCTAISIARPPRPEEVVTTTVPHQALYRRWRAQTFGEIVGQEAVVETLRNAVRASGSAMPSCSSAHGGQARPRSHGSWPRPSTARTSRTATPATPARPGLDPGGHDPRPDRDRRRKQPRHRRRAQPARTPAVPARPAPAQGLHPRRGAPDHQGRLERAPQVDRGAARLRHLHVRLDRTVALPSRDPVAPPALRRQTPHRRRDRRQAHPHPDRRPTAKPNQPPSTSSRGLLPAACATPN